MLLYAIPPMFIGVILLMMTVTCKNYRRIVSDGKLIIIMIFYIIPFLNYISVIIHIVIVIQLFNMDKVLEKKEINKFYKCCNCKMLTRYGYIEDSKCPACEKTTTFRLFDKKFSGSKDIFFHEKIKNKKKPNPNYEKALIKEQQDLYQEILKEKLKDKASSES